MPIILAKAHCVEGQEHDCESQLLELSDIDGITLRAGIERGDGPGLRRESWVTDQTLSAATMR
jgi:hypothetical protein